MEFDQDLGITDKEGRRAVCSKMSSKSRGCSSLSLGSGELTAAMERQGPCGRWPVNPHVLTMTPADSNEVIYPWRTRRGPDSKQVGISGQPCMSHMIRLQRASGITRGGDVQMRGKDGWVRSGTKSSDHWVSSWRVQDPTDEGTYVSTIVGRLKHGCRFRPCEAAAVSSIPKAYTGSWL